MLEQIKNHRHILIECNGKNFPQASILYSYMLLLRKKVSIYSTSSLEFYSFLAWSDKVRSTIPASAEYTVNSQVDITELYTFFKANEISINKKMATAFYAAYLKKYDNFLSPQCNGMVFAILSELIASGADHKRCVVELTQKVPLSTVRLKSIIYKKLLLKENASSVYVELCEEDFVMSGAQWNDLLPIAKELLNLAHVNQVNIIKNDEKEKIIKLNKEV